jgi:DNA end-binding protein Ku
MARAVWSGAISFGLVNVPVKAFTAAREHTVHFHQLEKGSGARVRYQKVSEKSGEELSGDDIELGYELSKGHYVTVDPDELADLRPRTTRTIDVTDFVALEEIDPIYYDHTYWLAPADETAERPYRLLVAALVERGRVGIGTVVMRRKQYLAAIRPVDGVLALSTMRFADEVVDRSAIDGLPSGHGSPEAKELKLATSIVDSLSSDWDPARYHDTYTDELKGLIKARAEGEEITVEEAPAETGQVLDLMAALEASVEAAKKKRGGKAARPAKKATAKPAAARNAPAKKAPAKKAPAKKAAATKAARRKSA